MLLVHLVHFKTAIMKHPTNVLFQMFLLSCFLFFSVSLQTVRAQSPIAGWAEPIEGIEVKPVFHATLEIKWNDKIILLDPSLDTSLLHRIDQPGLILITDIHGDHLNAAILAHFEKVGVPIIAPQAVYDALPENLKPHAKVLANGQSGNWEGITLEAVPMYNLADKSEVYHPKGRGNGYVLTMGGKKVYISGDTEETPEMDSLKGINLAFICMNLPYTMSVEAAAKGVLAFKPTVVIPYHYKGDEGLSDVRKFKKLVTEADPAIRVDLFDFYPKK